IAGSNRHRPAFWPWLSLSYRNRLAGGGPGLWPAGGLGHGPRLETRGASPRADEALDEMRIGAHDVGAAATLAEVRAPKCWRPPRREFPPGFHVAAPGPSHPEPAPAPVRRKPPPPAPALRRSRPAVAPHPARPGARPQGGAA